MKSRLALIIERLCCTCLITSRDWTWRIPIWPGRDDDGWLSHSVGSAAYTFESRILCRVLDWHGSGE